VEIQHHGEDRVAVRAREKNRRVRGPGRAVGRSGEVSGRFTLGAPGATPVRRVASGQAAPGPGPRGPRPPPPPCRGDRLVRAGRRRCISTLPLKKGCVRVGRRTDPNETSRPRVGTWASEAAYRQQAYCPGTAQAVARHGGCPPTPRRTRLHMADPLDVVAQATGSRPTVPPSGPTTLSAPPSSTRPRTPSCPRARMPLHRGRRDRHGRRL